MSTVKKGLLTSSGEWAQHLRYWGKRIFWHRERRAVQALLKSKEIEKMYVILDYTTKSLVMSEHNADEVLCFDDPVDATDYAVANLQKGLYTILEPDALQSEYL